MLTEDDFKQWGARYLSFQEEVGKNGTHHLQGYIEMPSPVRFTHFDIPEAHFDAAKGTPEQCDDYSTKEDTRVGGPYRFGTMCKQGRRTDLLNLRDAVRSGKRGRELFDDDELAGSAIKFGRGVDAMVAAYTVALPRDDLRVVLHFGPPGTGKTFCCQAEGCCMLKLSQQGGFWLNYNGEKHIILDEFSGHIMSPLDLQQLCDKYAYTANVKGGKIAANVCTVVSIYSFSLFNILFLLD